MTGKMKFSPDRQVAFYAETHRYIHLPTRRFLKSVTTFKKRFVPPFDPDGKILWNCAIREGVSPAELQARWKREAELGKQIGTEIHNALERYIKGETIGFGEVEESAMLYEQYDHNIKKVKIRLAESITPSGEKAEDYICKIKTASEVILYDAAAGLAGTADLIVSAPNGDCILIDFKTDKADRLDTAYDMLLEPFQDGANTPLNQYWIQLNLYREMIERAGGRVIDMLIFHIDRNTIKYTFYQIPREEARIKQILELQK